MATIIEAPETFPDSQSAPPKSHYDACAAYPSPNHGNAAGKSGLDLAGANTKPPAENHGATYDNAPAPAPPSSKPTNVQAPASGQAPAPKPQAPKPAHEQAPAPQEPAPKSKHPQAPAPHVAPQHPVEPVEYVPLYQEPVEPHHNKPVHVQSQESG